LFCANCEVKYEPEAVAASYQEYYQAQGSYVFQHFCPRCGIVLYNTHDAPYFAFPTSQKLTK